ncbi:MAG: putative oxidoreductase YhhX [Verrucomicrobiota bacterium]|jgi:predicted dehydrogenase
MYTSAPTTRRRFLGAVCSIAAASALPARVTEGAPIRIGQLGTKHAHASGKAATIRKFPEVFDFVGIVEPDPVQRTAVANHAAYRGLNWMTEAELFATPGLRAVAVETAVAELVPTALRCLGAGLHVHLDKPAGPSLDPCHALHRLAEERRRTVQMGYMFRYNPAFQFAHRIVRDGWLGEITEISGMMGKFSDDAQRRELAAFAGGGMFELACHLIDQVVYLLGPPHKVTAYTRRNFPGKDNLADNQIAILEYPEAIADIRCNHVDPLGDSRRQFSITGTQGTFEIRPLEPPRGRLGLDRPRGVYAKGFQDVTFPKPAGRYDEEFLDFARVIRGEKSLAWNAAHDLATQEAVLRASGML